MAGQGVSHEDGDRTQDAPSGTALPLGPDVPDPAYPRHDGASADAGPEFIASGTPTSQPTASAPIATVLVRGHGPLPRRRAARAQAPTPDERLLATLGRAVRADRAPVSMPVSALGIETALEAMAPASKLALAADLDCWLAWCAHERRCPLPADPEDLVRYLRTLEADGRKPATLSRRIASLATVHRLLEPGSDMPPTSAPMVRNALRANRRRRGAAQRQAAPLRFGGDLGEAQGFTLTALLAACSGDVQGLRDAALLSLGYDAGLRVGELTAVTVEDIRAQGDGTGLLHLPRSKTDQEGLGAWAWLSADTMRRIALWRAESGIGEGVLFRRVGVDRRRQHAKAAADARWGEADGEGAARLVTFTVGEAALTRQGVTGIYRRIALAAARAGQVAIAAGELDAAIRALSTHSLRVGLTQDLFAAGEDGAGIALTLRWSSPSTALRYGRQLQVQSGVAARVLSRVRS